MELPVTGIHVVDLLFGLLAQHAYLIAFAFAVVENVFVVGSFSFGETALLAAGFVASLSPTDRVAPLPLFAVVFLGEVLGSNVSYFIGLRGGRPLLERFGPRLARRIGDAEAYFERRGSATILLGRFAPGIKNFVFTIAGVSRMRLAVFEAYSVAGALAYSAAVIALGYFFGSNFQGLLKAVHGAGYAALFLVVALAAWALFNRWEAGRRRRRNEAARGPDGRG
ncbi:MAG TPA: DedA family protein [Coriobacteriia bacterium]|jgi:membrane protein DedA with SNARE-associated domain